MSTIHESVFIAPGVQIAGNVSIGKDSSIWYNSVLRSSNSIIDIGERTNIQDGCIFHARNEKCIVLGDDVTVGHGAIVHCCTIGNNTLIGMGAIIMTGAKIGDNCIVAAGALVTGGTVVPDGMMVMGSPAKIRRPLTEEEIQKNLQSADNYVVASQEEMERLASEE